MSGGTKRKKVKDNMIGLLAYDVHYNPTLI